MKSYSESKRPIIRHLSIRVPWHDSGWTGNVCNSPKENVSCLALDRIHDEKDDAKEQINAAKSLQELDQDNWPVCVSEQGCFMAPFEYTRIVSHPYVKTSPLHEHILPTTFRHPAYSAPAIPFRWVNTKTVGN